MANMKKVAQLAGVSLGTVSHVLNGTATVREPLRKRVLDAVRSAGYQPNQLARGLRRDKTDIIAMIIPDILNPFFPGVVRGAEDVAETSSGQRSFSSRMASRAHRAIANGYRLILYNTDNDHAKELEHLNALRT